MSQSGATVQSSSNSVFAGLSSKAGAGKTEQTLGQNEFFKLLVTQLGSQNPLNPMDNEQFIAQMAQFSTVSGVQQMQASMSKLAESMGSAQGMQAANLVGREVLTEGKQIRVTAALPADAAFQVDSPAEQARISIKDSNGQTVRVMNLAAVNAGIQQVPWDGLNDAGQVLPDGQYSFKVQTSIAGRVQDLKTYSTAKVENVVLSQSGARLGLADNLGEISLNQVLKIK